MLIRVLPGKAQRGSVLKTSDLSALDLSPSPWLLAAVTKASQRGPGCRYKFLPYQLSFSHDPPLALGPAVSSISPLFPPWPQIAFCLVMGLLFAVDTGLYFSVQRDLRRSMGDWMNGKVTWSKSPEDK